MVPLKLASAAVKSAPRWNGAAVAPAARQAYSHSASVGRRYTRPAAFSWGRADNRSQKSTASFQEIYSTGNVLLSNRFTAALPRPVGEKWLGLVPVTRSYSAWVTGKAPR